MVGVTFLVGIILLCVKVKVKGLVAEAVLFHFVYFLEKVVGELMGLLF